MLNFNSVGDRRSNNGPQSNKDRFYSVRDSESDRIDLFFQKN